VSTVDCFQAPGSDWIVQHLTGFPQTADELSAIATGPRCALFDADLPDLPAFDFAPQVVTPDMVLSVTPSRRNLKGNQRRTVTTPQPNRLVRLFAEAHLASIAPLQPASATPLHPTLERAARPTLTMPTPLASATPAQSTSATSAQSTSATPDCER
jgi:hypothetical protein